MPDVIAVEDNDPKMQAAIEKARKSVNTFIQAMANPQPSQSQFMVKMAFRDGKIVEHMWLSSVRYNSGKFYGSIENYPDKLTTVKLGDSAEVKKDEISDWMYVGDGRLVGGYTIRALLDSMPADERRKQEESVPFKID